ncbi:MAG TPA: tRNA lysidine(34) synthetase TilS [Vicinamibacterales bacterium]|nr:tRNA lysidine(34) synthetase TilS [Vicinamibacterales bacterium]
MHPVPERVLRTVRSLIPKGSRVIAAVSGGPDSVAMAHLLRELQGAAGLKLVGLAHLHHGLRGADADADEAFCRELGGSLAVEFVSERADVAAAAREWKTSVENAGRRLRYEFLERARAGLNADVIAVGHTRDDQAETFLLRLLRGAGPRGLSGIRRRRHAIVRPLLDVGRAELHAWLEGRAIAFRTDATNADLSIPRNRIRHELLPALERIVPGAGEAIARAADIADADANFLEAQAIEATPAVVLPSEDGSLRLDVARLKALHPAIARRVLLRAMAGVAAGRFIGLKHVDAVLALESGALDLPGIHAEVDGKTLALGPGRGRGAQNAPESNIFTYPLSIPGEARVRESGVAITAEIVIGPADRAETPDQVTVSAAAVSGNMAVRNRRRGDRFRPAGLAGRKKLQDYFVDRKVPRNERDRVPLVVDGRDRIVWIVGHTVAEDFRVTSPEGAVLLLKVRRLGELA